MFNNFLDSLDISGSQAANGRGKGSSVGAKMSASTNAIRMGHNHSAMAQSNSITAAQKRNKQLVSTSYNLGPSQLMQQQSQSYAVMRMSHQGFAGGVQQAGVPLNNSMVVTHGDLNNSIEFQGNGLANTTTGINRPGSQQRAPLNQSFDASKSTNNLNYQQNTAYMSTIPINPGTGPQGAKLSKVGLKHVGGNSRTNSFHPQTNYTD